MTARTRLAAKPAVCSKGHIILNSMLLELMGRQPVQRPGEQATEGYDLELRGSWGTQREDRGCTTSLKQPEQNSKLERVLESVAGDQYR